MDRQRIEGGLKAGRTIGERHPETEDRTRNGDRRAMDAVREVVSGENEVKAKKTKVRIRTGTGDAMDAVREVVNEEKK